MFEFDKKEMLIRYIIIGASLGLVLTVAQYALLFYSLKSPFSFSALASAHTTYPLLYIGDLLILPGVLIGYFLGLKRFNQLENISQQFRQETRKNEEIKRFTNTLIAGDFHTKVEMKHIEESLSNTLYKLKDTLIRNREMERERRLDERQRNWTSEGLAEFGDILRTHSMETEAMAYALISRLVAYLEANQGALFLTRSDLDGKHLEMIACHAYQRKKFPDRKVAWGDGLIGAAAMEKKGYYTDKIVDGYLTITSGLGKAGPNYLLIEPMIWNDQVFGVIELASFKKLEEHQLQFVRRVSENIATTLNNMESNLRTELLLKETREQADQLTVQEEQVRQNMDALKLAQEEGSRQAEIFISFTNTVNHTLMRAEYDTEGKLIYANTRFLKKMGYGGNKEVEGKHISMFIHEKDKEWFNTLYSKLAKGGRHFEGYMKHETRLGQDLWTMATYTGVRRDDGSVEKILFLAMDSTEQKKQSLDYEGQIAAIDRLVSKAIFLPDGRIQVSNSLLSKALKYTETELSQMNVFDFFGSSEQERFNDKWDQVIRGEAFQGQMKLKSKFDEELWFSTTLVSVDDMYGEVEKVIFLATEITREKEMEHTSRNQHEKLVRKEEELRLASLDLKKKLDVSMTARQGEKEKFEKALRQYVDVLQEFPYGLITINNRGFVLFINRKAEKLWKKKQKEVLGEQVKNLFPGEHPSGILASFIDPAHTKKAGTFRKQSLILPGASARTATLMLICTDLKEELLYTLIIMPEDS